MKDIFKSVAKLLNVRSLLSLAIIFALIYFVYIDKIEVSIFMSIVWAVVNSVFKNDD